MFGIVVPRLGILGDLNIVNEGLVKLLKPISEFMSHRGESVLIQGWRGDRESGIIAVIREEQSVTEGP